MNEIILDKKCFIKGQAGRRIYSSLTGEVVAADSYNIKKYGLRHGYTDDDFSTNIFEENRDFAFSFQGFEDRFVFCVFTPILIRAYGRQKYSGGEWRKVYQCSFFKDRHIEEEGLRDLDYWVKYPFFYLLNKDPFYWIIYNNFQIPGVKDLEMFVQIFKGKGLQQKEKNPSPNLVRHFRDYKNTQMEERTDFYTKCPLPFSVNEGTIYGHLIKDEAPVLLVEVVYEGNKRGWTALIGKDFFYSEEECNLNFAFLHELECCIRRKDLEIFDEAYPEFGLCKYLDKGGTNILMPLLAANYDRVIELLIKADCIDFANRFYVSGLHKSAEINWSGKNLKEIFGLPVKVIKKIDLKFLFATHYINILAEVYKNDPEFINMMDSISIDYMNFLEFNVVGIYRGDNTQIRGFANYDKKIQLRVAKYLFESVDSSHYRDYIDYLNMCYFVGLDSPLCGYTPKNVVAAHNEIMKIFNDRNLRGKFREKNFERALNKYNYYYKASDFGEEAEELNKYGYKIILPTSIESLFDEGLKLSHCVGTYVGEVANEGTQIFFLRKKEDEEKPFATIEVRNNVVRQVKAKCNTKVNMDAQNYVKKWAELKQLKIDTRDIDR